MWSKEHKRLARQGLTETQIQERFREREIIEYQRYNQMAGKITFHRLQRLCCTVI